MIFVRFITLILVLLGAINWGLWGFFQYDLIQDLLGSDTSFLARTIYSIVGIVICILSNKQYESMYIIVRLIIGFSIIPSFVYAGILISSGLHDKDIDLIKRGIIGIISGLIYVCSLILGINIAKKII